MSNIYDNINIVETSVVYDARTITGAASVAANDFDLSTITFLPNVPLEDQIEVERIFDTGIDSKFDTVVFTIADRRNMFVLPKGWYTINPQTKRMSINIPPDTFDSNGKYFPESRTYMTEGVAGVEVSQRVDIPDTLQSETTTFQYTPPGASGSQEVVREPDIVIIRRKTLSKESIVTFAPGTRLTTTQLNLQFDQLKFIVQELMSRLRNEIILKYDENAIDGPFLGNTDLRMSGRYIKNLNSPSLKDIETVVGYPFESGNVIVPGAEFAVNHSRLAEALYFGTMRREGVENNAVSFTGHFSAQASDLTGEYPGALTNRKIINLAAGTNDTDAATFGQVKDATNITTGFLSNDRLNNIPLTKLHTVTGQAFSLPAEYLANSNVTQGNYGASTASNTNNMVYMTVDVKGRVTALASRNMAVEDLPNSTVAQGTYGKNTADNTNNMLQLVVDTKGRITGATQRSLGNNDLPNSTVTAATYGAVSGTGTNTLTRFTVNDKGIITSASHRSIEVNDLPATNVTGAGTYGQATAGNSNNMLQVTYDARGRVTSISHRSMGTNDLPSGIPLSKLSGTNDGYTLPSNAIADTSITLAKINFGAGGTIPSGNLPTIDLANINPANRGSFVLPTDAIPNIVTATDYTTQPVKDISVDAKGRVTSVVERAIADGDIPSLSAGKITSGVFADSLIPAPATAPTAGSYGSASNIPIIGVDAKGRINTISTVTHAVANITDYTTATDGRIDNRALSRGTGSTYDAGSRKIINLAAPTTGTDAVNLNYLNANALVVSGGVISAASAPITNMTMRAAGSIAANDAVNYGFIENLVLTPGTTLIGSTTPQIYRDAWSTLSKTSGHLTGFDRYQRTFTDLGAVASTMVLLAADSVTKTFVPYSVAATSGTVHDGYFWLDTSGANKVLNVWLTTGTTPSGNLVTRNFGLSRLVSGALATTSSTGLVSIASGNDGGIAVDGLGSISLKQATTTQIGGIKAGTGVTIGFGSGILNVDLTDSVSSNNPSKVASAVAVKTAYDYAVGVNSSLSTTNTNLSNLSSTVTSVQTTANNALARSGGTMTGLVTLATSSSSVTPLRFVGGSAPSSPLDGAVWYESGTLKFRTSSGTKTLAFTDSSLTGSAATANALTTARSIALGGDLSGSANFNGSADITINATIQANSVALGTDTTGNYVATVAAGTGINVTGSGVETAGVTITNTDLGSAQNIFKTVNAGGTNVIANTNNSTLTVTAGAGISINGDNATRTVTITNTATTPNVFGTVAVAGTNLVADSSTDTLTISQGTGITLTSDAGTDTFTIANAGVTGLTGTTNQVNVSASTGSVTLSLPQAIHTAATPTFGSVTAKNLTLGSSNNTIISTDTNGNINLDPNGTGIVNIQSPLDVDGTLNVDGATTLVGSAALSSTLAVSSANAKIALGSSNAAAATTSINRADATAGAYRLGDLILRTPTSGKAWLVANDTVATAPLAADEIITQSSLTTALTSYVSSSALDSYMLKSGSLNSGAAQTLGTSTAHDTTIATNNTVRLTVGSAGGVTVNSGNLTVTNGNITIGGSTGKVVAAASTAINDPAKTLASKDYVDSKKWNYVFFTSGTGSWVCPSNVTEVEVFMAGGGAAGPNGGSLSVRTGRQGAMVNFTATVVPNTSYAYTVGVGGTAPLGAASATTTSFLGVQAQSSNTAQTGGTTSAIIYTNKAAIALPGTSGVTNVKLNRWVEANLSAPELPFTGIVGYYWLLTDSFKHELQQDGKALSFYVTNSTSAATPIVWSIGSNYIPGAGGQGESAGSADNYASGVGGVIMIKYWG